MENRINTWLEDILRSIDEIYQFLPSEKNFKLYVSDLKTKKAVERNLEIIGEAINRISKSKKSGIEIRNSKRIISTRNRIAHEYDSISDEIIWAIVVRELPILKTEIETLLQKD